MEKRPIGKQKIIEIDMGGDMKKSIILYEIRPFDAMQLLQGIDEKNTLQAIIEKVLVLCSNLSIEDLKQFYPSDLTTIYESFKEINSPFLKFSSKLNLLERGIQIIGKEKIEQMQAEFGKAFAGLFKQGIQNLSSTDGAIS